MLNDSELLEFLAFAEDLAESARMLAVAESAGHRITIKEDLSPVTDLDLAINEMVLRRVAEQYPDHEVRGEEASNNAGESDYVWVCDPIDGTMPFTFGLRYSCFMIALTYKGDPVVAVIDDLFQARRYTAALDKGAFCDGVPVRVNATSDISMAVLAGSSKSSKVVNSPKLRHAIEAASYRTLTLQCIAQEFVLTACGHLSGGVFVGDSAHDVAAGKLLVSEAGGMVTDLFGDQQRYDVPVRGVVFSNGHLHQELLELVKGSLQKK